MPVRSLNSSVLRWPDAKAVREAVQQWTRDVARRRPELQRVGYIGSYARGDWGVGSDVDLLVIVKEAAEPLARRGARWDTTTLPVPADVLVYTEAEWERFSRENPFGRRVAQEATWV
jgi:hypothetical protein